MLEEVGPDQSVLEAALTIVPLLSPSPRPPGSRRPSTTRSWLPDGLQHRQPRARIGGILEHRCRDQRPDPTSAPPPPDFLPRSPVVFFLPSPVDDDSCGRTDFVLAGSHILLQVQASHAHQSCRLSVFRHRPARAPPVAFPTGCPSSVIVPLTSAVSVSSWPCRSRPCIIPFPSTPSDPHHLCLLPVPRSGPLQEEPALHSQVQSN